MPECSFNTETEMICCFLGVDNDTKRCTTIRRMTKLTKSTCYAFFIFLLLLLEGWRHIQTFLRSHSTSLMFWLVVIIFFVSVIVDNDHLRFIGVRGKDVGSV